MSLSGLKENDVDNMSDEWQEEEGREIQHAFLPRSPAAHVMRATRSTYHNGT
jgi:hypothetical protein